MIGKMDKRIAIKEPTVVVSASGGTTLTLATVATVWARVKKMNESFSGDPKVSNNERYKITIWYDSAFTVTVKSRIEYNGKDLGVTGVEMENEKKGFIIIDAVSSI